MGMKVCKLVRLTKKTAEGLFDAKAKEGQITVRKRAIVSEESVKETEDNCESSGLLYVVNESATAARDKEVEAEIAASRNVVGAEVVKGTKAAGDTL